MGNETPTNDAPVTVEQQARLALESMMRATDDGALPIIRRLARIQARHALAALASAPAGDGVFTAAEALCNSATDDCTGKRTVTVDPDSFDTLNAALDAAERIGDRVEEALAAIEQHLTDFADAGDTTDDHDAHNAARKGLATIRLALARPRAAVGEQSREAIEAECAALIATYYRREIGTLMQQAEHWAENGKPLAVHHRVMKADDYFQIVCQMERDPAKGWKLPFDEIRDALGRKLIKDPGTYPPSKDLYRYRDPSFVVAALQSPPAKVEG